MKIARFSHDSRIAYGILDEGDLVVLAADPMYGGLDTTGERVPLADAVLLAPVIPRSKVIGMSRGYYLSESEKEDQEGGLDRRLEPQFFLKPNTTVVGPNDRVVLPAASTDVHGEAEIAIVIGKIAKNVAVEDAESKIFGYTVANDLTAVDLLKSDDHSARAKSFDGFCPLGPVIETEFDMEGVEVSGSVNGELAQSGDTALLRHSAAETVAFLSRCFTLLPGDVILTGGLGRSFPVRDGDRATVTVEGIGSLSNPVIRLG
ncbi:fumarylacetoacetate hydrolase family protein [Microterricola pindariensis]|uniref:2-hydroxyhepta-2,4-diene-1,7-dioate isomerase n=1 Tax=Microterricola pindariensis TaxID=478010 RepID=A0ABX5AXC1_9MICO|nr:fumarylacetoacetate hydrolase family protein [Microterricola pindariensis]PPL19026.1 2-hydroxyhepta-2,4-diene-1,7-dioate isomerase [Microterricola pindariensis]